MERRFPHLEAAEHELNEVVDIEERCTAIGANALNHRHPFFISWLYGKDLLFCDRHKYFDIISNAFYSLGIV